MSTIAELAIADDPGAWRRVGFAVDEDGVTQIGRVRLRISEPEGSGAGEGPRGLWAWTLAGMPEEVESVDGIPTSTGERPAPSAPAHPNGARVIDHVVVSTPDLSRTVKVVERTLGLPLKRTREGEAYGRPMRQAFFRLGEVILEVVGPPEPSLEPEPARFFGVAVTVAALDDLAELLGPDLLGPAKPAVQPGRFIATVRSAAGLAVPLAFMSPSA